MIEGIIVALISAVSVIATTVIQSRQATKKDNLEAKLDSIRNEFKTEINSIKEEINNEIKSLQESIEILKKNVDIETLGRCKSDLISLMSKIAKGYTPTIEEKRILIESKELYNSKGGDSYVDDMFDTLKKEGKI